MSVSSEAHPIVAAYLRAVEAGDVDAMLALFADGASADLTMRGTSVEGRALLSFLFHFDWTLPDGTAAPFDVVDVAEIDDDGLITSLRIVYDTVDVRPAFEAATRTSRRR